MALDIRVGFRVRVIERFRVRSRVSVMLIRLGLNLPGRMGEFGSGQSDDTVKKIYLDSRGTSSAREQVTRARDGT